MDPSISLPLQKELTDHPCRKEGTIPYWLEGHLFRNGPIPVTIDGKTNAHWFDGLAMIHSFAFHDGNVTYTNRFLQSDAYKTVFEKHSLEYLGFSQNPSSSVLQEVFSLFSKKQPLQNANVNISKIGSDFVALTEVPPPVRFDPETLATIGPLDFNDKLPRDRCWESAHPRFDLASKETINYLIDFGFTSTYTFYSLKEGSTKREILAKLPVDEPAYMHSFGLTEHYIVLTEFPFVVDPMTLLEEKPFIENFFWDETRGTTITVIDRKTGNIVCQSRTKAFFAFHHANAFEKDGNIVFDIVTYKNPEIIQSLAHYFSGLSHGDDSSVLERFTLSLETGEVTSEVILNTSCDLPRFNDAYLGQPYRFLYLTDSRDAEDKPQNRALYKVNFSSKEILEWSEENCFPGEPLFIASPNGKEEDEGVVLSLIFNPAQNDSFLIILDATTFKELGRSYVPHAIPPGLHNYFQKM